MLDPEVMSMNETIPNSFRADINTVFKMIAVLKHVDEFKKMCRGRYNTNKHDWCSCGLRELCQIRLTEILGHKSKANVYLFSLHAELLDRCNVIHIRKSNAPPGKPGKFYELDPEWEANFITMMKALVSEEEDRIMGKFGYDLDNTEGE